MRSAVAHVFGMIAAKATIILLLFGGFLVAASKQGHDNCTPESVDNCYNLYRNLLTDARFLPNAEGKYEEDHFMEACRRIKEKAPCHLKLENCSGEVRSSLRHREKGYEAARDIICEGTIWKDFLLTYQCTDDQKKYDCMEPHEPPSDPEQEWRPLSHPFCAFYEREIKCYQQEFNVSCRISLERAKVALIRVYDAMALLRGCKQSPEDTNNPNSAAAFVQPWLAVGVLSLTTLLQQFRTSR